MAGTIVMQKHSFLTRALHGLLAVAILAQLATAQIMQVPRPNRPATPLGASAFDLHELVGLAAMAIVLAFWAWLSLRRLGTEPGRLFPWFSGPRLRELGADIRLHLEAARRLTLPDPEASGALAGAFHGLGLLVALTMAATGTVGWLTWEEGQAMGSFTHSVFEVHEVVANLLWAYVIGHVGMTVVHELLGHRLLRRMSPLAS